jgi:hypothetical protein
MTLQERKNWMFVEMARSLLQAKDIPPHFRAAVVYCGNYLLYHISNRAIHSTTSVEQWCGKNPLVGHLHVFGCVSWAHISDDCRKNLDAKSHACILMRYSEDSKYYRLFDPMKKKIIIR